MKKILIVLVFLTTLFSAVKAATFNDINGLNCESAVENLKNLEIINGIGDNEYAPKKSVTRAELSKMIVNVLDIKASGQKSFSDIKNHWGEDFIKSAAEAGILKGYSDGTFKPDNEVSYAEAVAILVRSLGYENLETSFGKWYDGYISKMKEIKLDEGIEKINEESSANRGDVAILLWNTIKSNANGKSILETNFSDYEYFENQKITNIDLENGRILYNTNDLKFYVDSNIDFSNIGGLASGYINKKDFSVVDLKIDDGKNLKKISGNTKTVKDMGYDIFDCDNIFGYGLKEKAYYVEVFVDKDTNKTKRVVYYDTTESHFVEQIKIGLSKVSIDSRNVFDTSIIIHNGKTIKLQILRRETVKEIDKNAVLVYGGKIVPWTMLPDDSVVREIKKDSIYTYIHKYFDVTLNNKNIDLNGIIIDDKKYKFSDECIAENTQIDTATNFSEGITRDYLKILCDNSEKVRIFVNEFDEIVKFEFTYDIWKAKKEEERLDINKELNRIGFVTGVKYIEDGKNEDKQQSRAYPTSTQRSFVYIHNDGAFSKGDFVYVISGDKDGRFNKITENKSIGNLKVLVNYSGEIIEDRLGAFKITNDTEYCEVTLERDSKKENKYSSCLMKTISNDNLKNNRYKQLNIIVDKDNNILRVYAIKILGSSYQFGIVKNIERKYSGDVLVTNKVYITTETKGTRVYDIYLEENYKSGDLISYSTKKPTTTTTSTSNNKTTNKKQDDILISNDVYSHRIIGNKKDLVVKKYDKGILTFENSEDTINMKADTFKIDNIEYYFENYTFILANVEKDVKSGEWLFKYFKPYPQNKITINPGYRFVVDEMTGVIVVYSGYTD